MPALPAITQPAVRSDIPDLPLPAAVPPAGAVTTKLPIVPPAAFASFSPPSEKKPSDQKDSPGPNLPRLPSVTAVAAMASAPSRGSRGSEGVAGESLPSLSPVNPPPPYPPELLASRVEGTTVLKVEIDATGVVTSAQIDTTSGFEAFDRSALTTVRRWRFDPARRNGVPIASHVRVPIEFVIRR